MSNNRQTFFIFTLILSVFAVVQVHAQYPVDEYEKIEDPYLRFRTYSTADGLSNDYITALIQDVDGFIWAATQDGLNRFDGYGFKMYRNIPGDSTSLSDNRVTALAVDANGDVWAGTENGLNRFDRRTGRFQRFASSFQQGELADDWVRELLFDSKGRLWVFTVDGVLSEYDFNQRTFIPHPALGRVGTTHYSQGMLGEDADGNIIIGGRDRAAHVFNPEAGTFSRIPSWYWWDAFGNGIDDMWNLNGHARFDSTDYFATNEGIRYRQAGDTLGRIFSILSSIYAMELIDGQIWYVGYGGGVQRIDPKRKTRTAHRNSSDLPHSIPSDRGNCIMRDRSGCVWVGTNLGLAMHSPAQQRFTVYSGVLTSNHVTALAQAPNGLLWAATKSEGLNSIDLSNGKVQNYPPNGGSFLSHRYNMTNALYFDHSDNMWAGSWQVGGGFSVRDAKTQKVTNIGELYKKKYGKGIDGMQNFDWVFSMAEKDDTMYVANWGNGITAVSFNKGELHLEKFISGGGR